MGLRTRGECTMIPLTSSARPAGRQCPLPVAADPRVADRSRDRNHQTWPPCTARRRSTQGHSCSGQCLPHRPAQPVWRPGRAAACSGRCRAGGICECGGKQREALFAACAARRARHRAAVGSSGSPHLPAHRVQPGYCRGCRCRGVPVSGSQGQGGRAHCSSHLPGPFGHFWVILTVCGIAVSRARCSPNTPRRGAGGRCGALYAALFWRCAVQRGV